MTDRTLRLAHLTDAHLPLHGQFTARDLMGKRMFSALNWARSRRAMHRRAAVDAITADIADNAPDHIAMTGDAVNFGLPREFDAAADWLASLGAPGDVSFTPGNHEAIQRGLDVQRAAAFAPFATGDDGRAGFPYLRRRGPAAIIGVSSCISTPPFFAQGEVGAPQREALGRLLREAEGLVRVVLIHHPPTGPVKPRKHLRDREAVCALLAEAGAELVLHGHNHRTQQHWIEGGARRIPVLGAPSASIALAGHDEAAEWRLISIGGDGAAPVIEVERRQLSPDGVVETVGRFRLT